MAQYFIMEWRTEDANFNFYPRIVMSFDNEKIDERTALKLWQRDKTARENNSTGSVWYNGAHASTDSDFNDTFEPTLDQYGYYYAHLENKHDSPLVYNEVYHAQCVPSDINNEKYLDIFNAMNKDNDENITSLEKTPEEIQQEEQAEKEERIQALNAWKQQKELDKPWVFPHWPNMNSNIFPEELLHEELDVGGEILDTTEEQRQRLAKIFGLEPEDFTLENYESDDEEDEPEELDSPEYIEDAIETMVEKIYDISPEDFLWVIDSFASGIDDEVRDDALTYLKMRQSRIKKG
jgi:hypothetical protein